MAEVIEDVIIAGQDGVPDNTELLERLPKEAAEYKLYMAPRTYPEGETYSGEAIQSSAYGFFKGRDIPPEKLKQLFDLARKEIEGYAGTSLQIAVYAAPVQHFARHYWRFWSREQDWRPVKVVWTFHGSPGVLLIIAVIAFGIAAMAASAGFFLAVVKSKPIHFTGAIEAAKEAAEALPKTAKWLAIGAALVALLTITRS